MAKFITGKKLTDELCSIIKDAKKQLLIVSPYIQLDDYFKNELFNRLKGNSSLHILIAFGKNQHNPLRSIKMEDLNYFKEFPNISIVYIPNLHAKYYANEDRGLITSVNLYDYSFDNNVEFGVVSEASLFRSSDIDAQAWNKTMKILDRNYAVYIRRPNFKKKILFGKDYMGSDTQLDLTEELVNGKLTTKVNVFEFMPENYINDDNYSDEVLTRDEYQAQKKVVNHKKQKKLSATNLGKIKGKSFNEVILTMQKQGYILDKNTITNKGASQGLAYKENKNGAKWIVYPESLAKIL
ncbi:phospholipase D family protein [Winogradskyella alexanderae]|uniref:Phospholipase D family protein n=1 Tax=Winogradskyella alexanderae TaxID=2877123 RepID=A0ABS7XRG0_9FLAO|nr:phospholipase D family protein [Winogradskyella alexanderae]MCA0132612.1 phospholipase D family protein [Winogradskyella alexanderae]